MLSHICGLSVLAGNRGVRGWDAGTAGGEPADVDRQGLHPWVLPGEGEALRHGPAEVMYDMSQPQHHGCLCPDRGQTKARGLKQDLGS